MHSHFSKFSIFSPDHPSMILICWLGSLFTVRFHQQGGKNLFWCAFLMAARNVTIVYQTNLFIHLFFASSGYTDNGIKGCVIEKHSGVSSLCRVTLNNDDGIFQETTCFLKLMVDITRNLCFRILSVALAALPLGGILITHSPFLN